MSRIYFTPTTINTDVEEISEMINEFTDFYCDVDGQKIFFEEEVETFDNLEKYMNEYFLEIEVDGYWEAE